MVQRWRRTSVSAMSGIIARYGAIGEWDTSQVKDMSELLVKLLPRLKSLLRSHRPLERGQCRENAHVRCGVQSATRQAGRLQRQLDGGMYTGAVVFDPPLDKWDLSKVCTHRAFTQVQQPILWQVEHWQPPLQQGTPRCIRSNICAA